MSGHNKSLLVSAILEHDLNDQDVRTVYGVMLTILADEVPEHRWSRALVEGLELVRPHEPLITPTTDHL